MKPPLQWNVAWKAAAGVAACLALSLRYTVAWSIQDIGDPRYNLQPGETVPWFAAYYLMWAALTPLIFASARRVPFTGDRVWQASLRPPARWPRALGFHLAASVIVSAIAPTFTCFLFSVFYRRLPWAELSGPMLAYWKITAVSRAITDPLVYWIILAAGFALRAFDENRQKEQEAAELRRALVASQVEALKMKLQPHFLFNTLNSISFLAVEKDIDGVVTMVERLGRLLRSSMQVSGSQLVTVGEELALVDQYLSIEEARFTDRLNVSRRVAPTAMEALIPSLVLQPMIENSIKHGFSRRIDASRLELAIRREGDSLVVTVADDGPGVPPGWDLATHCGRGLKNVIERLDRLYPGEWGFTLGNQRGGGAIARLRIPWQVRESAAALPLAASGQAPA